VTNNAEQTGTPFEYGMVLDGATNQTSPAHIQADAYHIDGGAAKVTAATWEFWVKADSSSTGNRGALYGEFPAGTYSETRHYVNLHGIGTNTRFANYDLHPTSDGMAESDSPLFETSTFEQIVVTKDGDTVKFYKNGIQVGSTKTNSETYLGEAPNVTYFGKRETNSGDYETFDGQFCIIRVYEKALTAAEVQRNYNAEAGTAIPVANISRDPVDMATIGADTALALPALLRGLHAQSHT
jgi:hypothetical protein